MPVVAILQMGKLRHAVTQQPMHGHQASGVRVVSGGHLIFLAPAPDSSLIVSSKPHLVFMEV